jgi:diamine N-acetyltransferase
MIITGEKILLRPIKKEDYKSVFNWFNQKDVIDNLIGFRPNFSMEEALSWCEKSSEQTSNSIKWAIETLTNPDIPIGFTGLYNINYLNRNAESAIIIGEKNSRGKGIGKEALEIASEFAFKYLNLQLIYANILSSNSPSLNLYKGVGFEEEGVLRKRIYRNGHWHDIVVLSLLKER